MCRPRLQAHLSYILGDSIVSIRLLEIFDARFLHLGNLKVRSRPEYRRPSCHVSFPDMSVLDWNDFLYLTQGLPFFLFDGTIDGFVDGRDRKTQIQRLSSFEIG